MRVIELGFACWRSKLPNVESCAARGLSGVGGERHRHRLASRRQAHGLAVVLRVHAAARGAHRLQAILLRAGHECQLPVALQLGLVCRIVVIVFLELKVLGSRGRRLKVALCHVGRGRCLGALGTTRGPPRSVGSLDAVCRVEASGLCARAERAN